MSTTSTPASTSARPLTDPMALRESLARAANRSDVLRAVAEAANDLHAASEQEQTDPGRRRAIDLATIVSYHSFLFSPDLAMPEAIIQRVRPQVESAPWDRPRDHLRAQLSLHVALHRIARSKANHHALHGLRRTILDLSSSLYEMAPSAPELTEWSIEDAHYERNKGNWSVALPTYVDLNTVLWHPLGYDYQRLVLSHYIVSTACDWLEMLSLPPGDAASPVATVARRVSSIILEFLALERPGTLREFPQLRAHHSKHRSICLAWLGDFEASEAAAQDALSVFSHLNIPKGISLAMLYRGDMLMMFGKTEAAAQRFRDAQVTAERAYPRAWAYATVQLMKLAYLDGSSIEVAQCHHALTKRGLLQSKYIGIQAGVMGKNSLQGFRSLEEITAEIFLGPLGRFVGFFESALTSFPREHKFPRPRSVENSLVELLGSAGTTSASRRASVDADALNQEAMVEENPQSKDHELSVAVNQLREASNVESPLVRWAARRLVTALTDEERAAPGPHTGTSVGTMWLLGGAYLGYSIAVSLWPLAIWAAACGGAVVGYGLHWAAVRAATPTNSAR